MPYHADLRCSYSTTKININWFYEAMDEYREDIEYIASKRITGTKEECEEFSKNEFEKYIEYLLNYYISAKVFNFKPIWKIGTGGCIDTSDNIWEFIHNMLDCYDHYDKEVIIKSREDTEDTD